jgi:hypothetical protein
MIVCPRHKAVIGPRVGNKRAPLRTGRPSPRPLMGTRARRLAMLAALVAAGAPDLAGQARDTVGQPAHIVDTTHTISPTGALWRSLLIPGWGQAATGRNITGALFVTWEGVTMMMTLRAVQEEGYLNESGSANIVPKRQEVQDWVVLWIFNHFFSGAEAFVSAELLDFPKNLKVEASPQGVEFRVPLP